MTDDQRRHSQARRRTRPQGSGGQRTRQRVDGTQRRRRRVDLSQLSPEERAQRRAAARRKAALRAQRQRRARLTLVGAVLVLVLLIVLLVWGIVSCTSGKAQSQDQGAPQAPATTTATTAPATSAATAPTTGSATTASPATTAASTPASTSVEPNVPDPAWKQAAGVPELTKQGTDPTRIAAEKQAEREAANLANGYQGVKDSWVKGGYFTTGDKELDEMVKSFCDKHSTAGASAAENAQNTFNNITWSDYDEWEGNQYPNTYDWQVGYAKDFFQRGGNCFSMASAIQWCMRYFGYSDAHAELTYQQRQSGGWLDHGLTWLTDTASGEIRMIDSEQATKGWMMKPGSYNVEILDPTSNWEPRSSAFNVQRNN